MADSEKVTVSCHKSTSASKTIWTEEEKEHLTSLWSGEDLLFNCENKDYFKKETRHNHGRHGSDVSHFCDIVCVISGCPT